MNFVIVPVRNGLHYTRNAMKDFLDQDIGDVCVLVIDNASRDGTAQWLATLDSRVHTAHFEKPLSVAASWNYGLRWVFGPHPKNREDISFQGDIIKTYALFKEEPEYCLVVNNDVRLRPDTYRHLVEDGGGFVTAVGTKDPEKIEPEIGSEDLHSNDLWCGHQPNTGTVIGRCYWPNPNPDAKRPHPDFSCYLIRRPTWEKVGPFNENFKGGFCEDWDMHVRLHKAGIAACCIDLPFVHYGSQTLPLMTEEERRLAQDQAGRNREYFKELHGFEGGSKEYYDFFGHDTPDNP
ncbi:MAG: glycosyltransferase family 2 protein [Planctomycetota bacterium]|jgi:GT2 family glycosyltransferase